MTEHVNEWLNAYLDGELHGNRLQHVEKHLAECQSCKTELESLQGLSRLLHEAPVPEFTSPERFAAQVNLLLPQRSITAPRSRLFEIGWWMIPVGLLAVWAFIGTATIVSNIVSTANDFGVVDSASTLLISGTSGTANWTSVLSQLGFLEESSLEWIELTENYSKNVIPQFVWQVSIALLYLTWIAIWWARQTRHERQSYGQLLEG